MCCAFVIDCFCWFKLNICRFKETCFAVGMALLGFRRIEPSNLLTELVIVVEGDIFRERFQTGSDTHLT